jgi:hypothetical protein
MKFSVLASALVENLYLLCWCLQKKTDRRKKQQQATKFDWSLSIWTDAPQESYIQNGCTYLRQELT